MGADFARVADANTCSSQKSMTDPRLSINLSLISHTNSGKTTLARSLLGRDVGEVRDTPHVTDVATAYRLQKTSDGAELLLWDTPGFGDTARLLRRLKASNNPVGWIMSQLWDRHADRPLWCSQQAMRNARETADVILYLVNAAEDPSDAAYVDMEMEILSWVGKPVVVLLNQTGPPRGPVQEALEQEKWRSHLQRFAIVRQWLTLDAFARCWIQEGVLLRAVGELLPESKREPFARMIEQWREQSMARFHSAMKILARQLAVAAHDRQAIDEQWTDRARAILRSIGVGRAAGGAERERAMALLAERLDSGIRSATDQLIALHGLEGHAAKEVLRRMQEDYALSEPVSEGYAAVLGGIVSGALGGLAADLAAGGLSFGAGAVGGGILGALGAGGLAKGYNVVRGADNAMVRWSSEFFQGLVRSALLRYLAVAHFGRGRGNYSESEHPKFWQSAVLTSVGDRVDTCNAIWEQGRLDVSEAALADEIEAVLAACAAELLEKFYPGAGALTYGSTVAGTGCHAVAHRGT
jgi:GTPase SAR1 family protein